MSPDVHVVLDWDAGDGAVDELLDYLARTLPQAMIVADIVPRGDALQAGRLVARKALSHGVSGRVVAHDVAATPGATPAWREEPAEAWFCVARSRTGVLVLGGSAAAAWEPAKAGLSQLCRVDVPAGGAPPHPPARLAAAIVHVCGGHPHTVAGIVRQA
jgi:hypothetical protein